MADKKQTNQLTEGKTTIHFDITDSFKRLGNFVFGRSIETMTQTITITSPPVHEDQVLKLNEVSDKLFKGDLEAISLTNEDFSHFIDSHDAKSIEQYPNLERFLK